MKKVTDALQGLLGSASVNVMDKVKVQALLQSQSGEGDMDLALALQPAGAPDPAAYKAKSGGILDTLEDMLEKAKAEHADAQKAEMNAKFDFDMLKQKLEDAIAVGNKDLGETKTEKAAAEEAKAVAEGELETADKGVADDSKKLQDLQQDCMTKSTDYEASQHSRSEELAALDKAKTILKEKTGGAAERSYSFLQLEVKSRASAKAQQVKDRVLVLVQSLADKEGSKMMSLLAQRVQSAMLTSADPFAKVKGMIQEMIEKLVAEAQKEASHKAFCDKEMSETKAKMEDKQEEVDDLTTKIDKSAAKVAKLKEEVATLEKELMKIAAEQKEATEMRESEKAAWESAKADFESGLEGVQMALQVLRDYYAEKDDSADALLQSD